MNDESYGIMVTKAAPEKNAEKVSVNMNVGTLSAIDLLVDSGYYSNRSDFINQAVRELIARSQSTIDRLVEQNSAPQVDKCWFLGTYYLTRERLEEMIEKQTRFAITGYGMLTISRDCDDELVFKAVKSMNIRGKVRASDAVKAYYGLK